MSADLSYRQAYARLAEIVEEMEAGDLDLDRALTLVEEAGRAYALCQSRIEAVRLALGEAGWLSADEVQE